MIQFAEAVDAGYLERAAQVMSVAKQAGLAASTQCGPHVVDVGCGPGLDTVTLAQTLGAGARVVGVDVDPAMVAAADRRAADASVSDRVVHHAASAYELPLPTGSFDVARADRLLQHTVDPELVVGELARVTRRGGQIVLIDTDWGSLSLSSLDTGLERRVCAGMLDAVPNPTVGRQLPQLLSQAGCDQLSVTPFVVSLSELGLARIIARLPQLEAHAQSAGRLDDDELHRWRASCERLETMGAFYGYAVVTVAVGRRVG